MKHEKAYCYNGEIYEPKDIKSRNKLVEMRYHGLTDTNREFVLIAVNSETPYFRFKNSPGKSLSRNESNPNHEIIKNRIYNLLKNSQSLKVYTNEFKKVEHSNGSIKYEPFPHSIVNLPKDVYQTYEWRLEAFKKITKAEYTSFDICGYSASTAFSTSVKPKIFIEIVVNSFLKSQVFEFHCKISELDNSTTLFFYVPEILNKNELSTYWNSLEDDNGNLSLRVTQYIDNGYFYEGKKQIAYLYKDEKMEMGFVRPEFNRFDEEREYWEKHHIYITENYFKKARKKLNQ